MLTLVNAITKVIEMSLQRAMAGLVFGYILMSPQLLLAADGHADPHWNYEEQQRWGALKDPLYQPPFPYAECGIGQKQSPVNIQTSDTLSTDSIDELQPRYVEIPLSLTNNGHTLRINIAKGMLFFGRNAYDLVQFHFHAPSEHLLDGQSYPLEIHFVNGTADGRMAVVAVLVKAGAFNQAFQAILDHAPSQAGQSVDTTLSIQPNALLPLHSEHFYTYAGSLTTPPCSEGVQWFVLQALVEISEQQINDFKTRFYHDNARIEQRLNGRKLELH